MNPMFEESTRLDGKIWVIRVVEDVLRAGPVAAVDSFHAFGGSSLQAMRVCVRVEKETGVKVAPEFLLDSDSIGAFADTVVALVAAG
ncbi:acyl carrier protein [Streptomyces jumonjinensis]|uniref:Acyl carrier protein n=2 Tax=Streptomyces jumonjinensis TaxID=1945 RepID=A0A646KU58_STRJU|nr:acyl carrier protein [Streptomyces jumonjinensis]